MGWHGSACSIGGRGQGRMQRLQAGGEHKLTRAGLTGELVMLQSGSLGKAS